MGRGHGFRHARLHYRRHPQTPPASHLRIYGNTAGIVADRREMDEGPPWMGHLRRLADLHSRRRQRHRLRRQRLHEA